MKTFKIISAVTAIFLLGNSHGNNSLNNNVNENNTELKWDSICASFIANYSPVYIHQQDTFVVARFAIPAEDLNYHLIDCAKHKDFHLLKYSAALIIRHNYEYDKVNHTDYLIGDGALLNKNGFIVLLREAMGFGEVNDDISMPNYFPFYTGDITVWIRKHKRKIEDYKYVEQYRKNLTH
jgi:hypothetical protein